MNIADTEYTTKADVVVDIENPDKKPEEKNGDILKERIDSVEVQREEQVTLDENPFGCHRKFCAEKRSFDY